jgi:hypothetical protein
MNIEVRIEELVLLGLEPKNRHHVVAAVRLEFERLLRVHGLRSRLTGDTVIRHIRAPDFQLAQSRQDEAISTQVANAAYEAISNGILP